MANIILRNPDSTAVSQIVDQIAHGFTLGQCVYFNDSASPSEWDLAQADDTTTLKRGVVSGLRGPDQFVVTTYGKMDWALHGFTPETTRWLSDTTPGDTITDPPTSAGTLNQVAFDVIDANTVFVLDQAVVDNSLSPLSTRQWIDQDAALSPGIGYTVDTRTQNVQLNLPDPLVMEQGNFIQFDWAFTDITGSNTVTLNGNGALIESSAGPVPSYTMIYGEFLNNIELTFDGTNWIFYSRENKILELTPTFYDFNDDEWGRIAGNFVIDGVDGALFTNAPFNPVNGVLYDIKGYANYHGIYASDLNATPRGTGSPPSAMEPRFFIRDGENWDSALINGWQEIGGPIQALTASVAQPGHGFTNGTFVYNETTGSPPTTRWELADSSAIESTAHGMVTNAGLNLFDIATTGLVLLPAHGLNPGAYYYLSDTTPGGVSPTLPANATSFAQPVLKVVDADTVMVLTQAPTSDTAILAEAVIKAPQASTRNDIEPEAADDVIPLRIVQNALHSVNALELHTAFGQQIEFTSTGNLRFLDDGAGSPPGMGIPRTILSAGDSGSDESSGITIFDTAGNERFNVDGTGQVDLSHSGDAGISLDPVNQDIEIIDANDRTRVLITGVTNAIRFTDATNIPRTRLDENSLEFNAPTTGNRRAAIDVDGTNDQVTFSVSNGTDNTRIRLTHDNARPRYEGTNVLSNWSDTDLERFVQTFSAARRYPAGDKVLNESKQFEGDTAIWLALVNVPAGVWNWNDIEGGGSGNNYWRLISGGGGSLELYSATEIYQNNEYIFQWDTRRGTTWLGLWQNNTGGVVGPEAWDQDKWTLVSGQYYKTFGSEFTNTGVVNGGEISTAGGSGINVGSGTGVIVDKSNPGAITSQFIEWPNTFIDLSSISIDTEYYIWVDNTGTILTSINLPNSADYRANIYLGYVAESAEAAGTVGVINSWPMIAQNSADISNDINRLFIGTSLVGGGTIYPTGSSGGGGSPSGSPSGSPGGSTNLWISNDAGRVYLPGVSFHTNPAVPNEITFSAEDPITFDFIDRTPTIIENQVRDINVTHWDNNGVQTFLSPGAATTHRLFYLPSTDAYLVLQGQEEHPDFDTAKSQITSDDLLVSIPNSITQSGVFLGWITVTEGATDSDDNTEIQVLPGSGTSFGGSGTSVEDLNSLTDVSIGNPRSFEQLTFDGTLWRNTPPNIMAQWVNQPSHGFIPGQQVYYGSAGSPLVDGWHLADSSNESSLKQGHVAEVDPPDWFLIVYNGTVKQDGHGYTVGTSYWLSDDGSGNPTINAPSDISSWKQVTFSVVDADTIRVVDFLPEQNADIVYSEFISRPITQPGHGFTVWEWITQDDTGTWIRALANDINTLATSLVINVSGDDFIIVSNGDVERTGHGLTSKTVRYLSDTTPGADVDEANAPQLPGTYQQGVMEVLDANTIRVIDKGAISN